MRKPIEDPATQVASCDVPRAKLEVDTGAKLEVDTCVSSIEYLTVSDTTSIGVCLDSCASVAARQRFSRHSNSKDCMQRLTQANLHKPAEGAYLVTVHGRAWP